MRKSISKSTLLTIVGVGMIAGTAMALPVDVGTEFTVESTQYSQAYSINDNWLNFRELASTFTLEGGTVFDLALWDSPSDTYENYWTDLSTRGIFTNSLGDGSSIIFASHGGPGLSRNPGLGRGPALGHDPGNGPGPGGGFPVPEPATMMLMGAGLIVLAAYTRKKIKKA